MEIFIFLALMLAMMWFVTSRGKKQQAAARQRLEESLVPGTWVMTIGGFFGQIVEIDGDVVTLESPSGIETIWSRTAIREAKEPPFASAEEEDDSLPDVVVPDDAAGLAGPGTTTTDESPGRDDAGPERPDTDPGRGTTPRY